MMVENHRMVHQGQPDELTDMEIGTAQIQALVGIGYAILAVRDQILGQRKDADPEGWE